MKKFFLIFLFFMPIIAFADDLSDCEIIGHKVYAKTIEECTTPPEICKEEPNSAKCLNNIKTIEQCSEEIENINKLMSENYLLFKCPATQERTAQKNASKVTTNSNYVYNDGTSIDTDAMVSDENFVYIFRMGAGLFGAFTYTEDYQDYILGVPEKDGTNLAIFK